MPVFAHSSDGVRIAYERDGIGPPLILLHGGQMSRQSWHDAGYVDRLNQEFEVVTIDLRGNGESDKPVRPQDYHVDRHCDDILAVADACGIGRFALWGFSLGGNIGRYLAAQSSRVISLIMIGATFGLGASGEFRRLTIEFCHHWTHILKNRAAGVLDIGSLSQQDQELLKTGNVPLIVSQASGILGWGDIQPKDVRCPTLWIAGSGNKPAMDGIEEYDAKLKGSKVRVQVIEGLNHSQEFSEVDKALPIMLSFTKAEGWSLSDY